MIDSNVVENKCNLNTLSYGLYFIFEFYVTNVFDSFVKC